MNFYIKSCVLVVLFAFSLPNNQILDEKQQNDMMLQAMQIIWEEAMKAKESSNAVLPQIREELLENLCSSAPRPSFVTHADLSDELTSAPNTSASIFVSTDNQINWIQNDDVGLIGSLGYETTWGATTATTGGSDVVWYLSGSIDSDALDLDLGQVTVSQSPFNENNSWPPPESLYAIVTSDVAGDASSGQDITNIKATYSENSLYASMELSGACCSEGGFFGPWYLYAIAVVNPDALDNGVAYAYAYGDGGFGELYPGIYKIYGDFSSGVGDVGNFEVLSENFNYSTSGNQLQAASLLSIITDDPDWGLWPNSLNGVALVGVTVEAGLDGLDVAITPLDNSDVGVLVLSTQSQSGNSAPVLINPSYENNVLSVTYSDVDGNLPVYHEVFIEGDMVFNMVPSSHSYSEGVVFALDEIVASGVVTFSFSDGAETVSLDYDLGGGDSCSLLGDANGDNGLNVLDVVLTVNIILSGLNNYEACSDINNDNALNILDVVLLVNLILGVG